MPKSGKMENEAFRTTLRNYLGKQKRKKLKRERRPVKKGARNQGAQGWRSPRKWRINC